MWNRPTKQELEKIPKLYATESTPTKDKKVVMHFFIGGCDWYVVEFDGADTFFAFCILNNDYNMAEWGYISFKELCDLKVGFVEVDRDLHWQSRKASETDKIIKAGGA